MFSLIFFVCVSAYINHIYIAYSKEVSGNFICSFISPSNTVLPYFFFSFLIIDWYFLIHAVTAQIFVPTVELKTPKRTQSNEGNTEIETQPVTLEAKTSKFLT